MPKITTALTRPGDKNKALTALGAYVFAGGFTVGVLKHFDVLGHFEGDKYGVSTFKKNYPNIPVHIGVDNWPVDQYKVGTIDFLFGNPPCACWSGNNPNSHKVGSWENDPRVSCTKHHFDLLTKLRPKVWAWESVTQAPEKGEAFVTDLTKRALAQGFSVTHLFIDAMYCGTPQTRKRFFMVCHRVQLTFPPPDFTKTISAVEALKKVKPKGPPAYDSGRFNKLFEPLLHKVKPGQRLRKFWEDEVCPPHKWERKENGHVKGRVGLGHIRLKDKGVATATVGYSMVHPTEDRFLHTNEVQALAGFPQSFDFMPTGTCAKELDLIARGVCPPVGEWLARHVATACRDNRKVTRPMVYVVDYRTPASPFFTNVSHTYA